MRCKQVCKAWRDLIESPEFATSHLSLSKASYLHVMFRQLPSRQLPSRMPRIHGCVDELLRCKKPQLPRFGIFELDNDSHGCTAVTRFGFEFCQSRSYMTISANGLLLLEDEGTLLICNPVTREYTQFPPSQFNCFGIRRLGFGVSKLSGLCKVVKIYGPCTEVYSAGQWKTAAAAPDDNGTLYGEGIYTNGNLHWLMPDSKVRCFDLDTEVFATFNVPPIDDFFGRLCELEGHLCLCDYSGSDESTVIWVMSKYGDDKSWRKEFVIKEYGCVLPLKLFKDSYGNSYILFHNGVHHPLYSYSNKSKVYSYSNKSKAFKEYSLDARPTIKIFDYAPSFLSLKTMGIQPAAHIQSF